MPDFIDILPPVSAGIATVFGHEFPIRPLKNKDWAAIGRRYPDLRKTMFKDAPDDWRGMAMYEAMPAIIAAGLGKLGDKELEAAIEDRMPQADQMELGGKILDLTYPRSDDADPLARAAALAEAALEAARNEITSEPQ